LKAIDVFRQNMIDVLGKASVRALVKEYNQAGETIDYSYVHRVRNGTQTPSVDKSEQIVDMLRLLPGYDWVENWMFLVPDYFKTHSCNVLKERQFSQQYFEGFVSELMATAHRFQILQLEQKQFEQVAELARYIYQKKHGEPVAEPEEAGKRFLA
jgi:hypothetical protein